MRRRGMTFVEFLVVFALLSVVGTLTWNFLLGGSRQAKQVEEISDLVRSALLLQETLTTDLERALSLRALDPALVPRGTPLETLTLPLFKIYRTGVPASVRYRAVEYRWDPEAKKVLRNGETVVGEGLEGVVFRWTPAPPTMLEVELQGSASFHAAGNRYIIRLPAPQGTDGLPIWRFAGHHQQAEPET